MSNKCPFNCTHYVEFCYMHCKNFDCHLEKDILAIIANRFSVIYGAPRLSGPCACMGIECGNLACEAWWRIAFRDKEIREQAIRLYRKHKYNIENGCLTLLGKRFLKGF